MSDPLRQTTLRWERRSTGFFALVLGRIEIAQISKATASENWFYTLRFCAAGERASYSVPTEAEAKAIAEHHAARVLA